MLNANHTIAISAGSLKKNKQKKNKMKVKQFIPAVMNVNKDSHILKKIKRNVSLLLKTV